MYLQTWTLQDQKNASLQADCLSYYGVPDTSGLSPVSTMKANLCTITGTFGVNTLGLAVLRNGVSLWRFILKMCHAISCLVLHVYKKW